MLFAIDIGNSNIHIGFFERDKLKHTFSLSTTTNRSVDEYKVVLKLLINEYGCAIEEVEGVIIGSVVPSVTGKIQHAVSDITGAPIMLVGPGVKTGFHIKLDDPTQLGADLAANAAAAIDMVGHPAIIVDFGTATTVSAIDNDKAYVGCYIMPGIQMSLDALHSTELLPGVFADKAVPILGKNSADSMRAGVVFGSIMAAEGFIEAYKRELNLPNNTPILVTGGYASDIVCYFKPDVEYVENLTLQGLNSIYKTNKAKKASKR